MNSKHLRSILALVLTAAAASGCAVRSGDPDGEVVDEQSQAFSSDRTFEVSRTSEGCEFPYKTLYVRRGGTLKLENKGKLPLLVFVDWPNALGEDGGNVIELEPGESEKVEVPYLDAELYSGGRSLEFPVTCGDTSENVWMMDSKNKVRIYR